MTDTLSVSPLSPVRPCANSRSFISGFEYLDRWRNCLARQQHRLNGNDLSHGLRDAASGGRAIGIERFDLVADPRSFIERITARHDAHAHFVWLHLVRSRRVSIKRIDADEIAAQLAYRHPGHRKSLAHHIERKTRACQRARAPVRDLP